MNVFRWLSSSVFAFMLLMVPTFADTQKLNIAVNDLLEQGIEKSTALLITDRLRSELFNTGLFTVLEREQMTAILKEQDFQQSDCASDQCAVQVGQLLGVTHMITGSIGLVGQTFTLNLRMIQVSTGQIIFSTNIDCKCRIDDVLSKSTVTLARKLAENEKIRLSGTPAISPSGSLGIYSKPAGAKISINDSARGTTPFKSDSIPSGTYRILLNLSGYVPAMDSFEITGNTLSKSYRLAPDSVLVRRIAKRVFISRVVLGSGALLLAGSGVFVDQMVKSKIDENSQIAQAYADSRSNLSYEAYASQYESTRKGAKDLMLIRNAAYGAAAVFAAGICVTFLF